MTATDSERPQHQNSAGTVSPVGLLGLCSVFLSAIFAFIIAMEYDPLARDFKDAGLSARGQVLSKANLELTVRYVSPGENAAVRATTVRPLSRGTFASFEVGEEIEVLVSPEDPRLVWPLRDFPTTPRQASDAWFPLLLFVLGLLGVIAGPEVLYGSEIGTLPVARTKAKTSREASRS